MPSIKINVIKFKFADKVVVFTRFELRRTRFAYHTRLFSRWRDIVVFVF